MKELRCPVCDKEFILAPKNIYKAYIGGKVRNLCGWNCMREAEREQEAKKRKSKERKQDADR